MWTTIYDKNTRQYVVTDGTRKFACASLEDAAWLDLRLSYADAYDRETDRKRRVYESVGDRAVGRI